MSSSADGSSGEERRAADLAAGVEQRAADLADETRRRAADLAAETAAKALTLASALSGTLTEIAARLDEYAKLGRRRLALLQRIIIALAVSFALDVTLTVLLGLTAFQAHGTANANAQLVTALHGQQAALHAAQLTACAGGNRFRADQDIIWRDFIGIVAKPAPGEPPAQVAKTNRLAAQFLAYVSGVNHPVNCTALYGKG